MVETGLFTTMVPSQPATVCRHARRYHKLAEAMFVGELSPARARRLREHLRGCSGCRQYYNRLMLVERAVAGGTEANLFEPSALELERIVAAGAPLPDGSRRAVPAEPAWQRWRWVMAPLAAALVIAVALPLMLQNTRGPAAPVEYIGVKSSQPVIIEPTLRVVFGVRGLDSAPVELVDGQAVPADGYLKFIYRHAGAYRSLRVALTDSTGTTHQVFDSLRADFALAPDATDDILPGTIWLRDSIATGPAVVEATFADPVGGFDGPEQLVRRLDLRIIDPAPQPR